MSNPEDSNCHAIWYSTHHTTTPHTPSHQAPKPGKPAACLAGYHTVSVSSTRHYYQRPLISPTNSSCSPSPGPFFHSSPPVPSRLDFDILLHRLRESRQLWAFRSKHSSPRPASRDPRVNRTGRSSRPSSPPCRPFPGPLGLGRLSRLFSRPAQIDWLSDHLAWPAIV